MSYQAMKRREGSLHAYYSVKEGNRLHAVRSKCLTFRESKATDAAGGATGLGIRAKGRECRRECRGICQSIETALHDTPMMDTRYDACVQTHTGHNTDVYCRCGVAVRCNMGSSAVSKMYPRVGTGRGCQAPHRLPHTAWVKP